MIIPLYDHHWTIINHKEEQNVIFQHTKTHPFLHSGRGKDKALSTSLFFTQKY